MSVSAEKLHVLRITCPSECICDPKLREVWAWPTNGNMISQAFNVEVWIGTATSYINCMAVIDPMKNTVGTAKA